MDRRPCRKRAAVLAQPGRADHHGVAVQARGPERSRPQAGSSGYFPEPAGAHFAVGLGFVGGAEEKGDVYIVSPDGTSVALPSGIHVVFRY